MLSMTPLLMHSDAVPAEARSALRAAYDAPPDHRAAELKTAARALYESTDLECAEVLDLVGLPNGTCG
jgi:hypothetical protein